jgi:DnaD/phage-associated family protein
MDKMIEEFNLEELEKELEDIIEDEEQQERFVIVREGLVKLTGGFMEAAVLSSMISWQRTVNRMDKKVFDQIKEAVTSGNKAKASKLQKKLHYGWFYKKAEEMREEMFNAASVRTIRRIFERLESMKFIESKQLPNFDRKKYYKVNIAYIRTKLAELGYNLDGYKLKRVNPQNVGNSTNGQNDRWENPHKIANGQNDRWKGQNDRSNGQNGLCNGQDGRAIALNYSLPSTTLYDSLPDSMYVHHTPPLERFAEVYRLTGYAKNELKKLIQVHGELLVSEALERTIKAEKDTPIAYIKGILKQWSAKGVKTLEDIKKAEQEFRDKRKKRNRGKVSKLPQAVADQQLETGNSQEQQTLSDDEELKKQQALFREKLKVMHEQSLNK